MTTYTTNGRRFTQQREDDILLLGERPMLGLNSENLTRRRGQWRSKNQRGREITILARTLAAQQAAYMKARR